MASPILQCARWAGVRVWALAGVVPEGLGVTRTGYRAPIPMENSGKWAGALQSQVQTYLFFLLQCGRGHVFTSIRQGFFISVWGYWWNLHPRLFVTIVMLWIKYSLRDHGGLVTGDMPHPKGQPTWVQPLALPLLSQWPWKLSYSTSPCFSFPICRRELRRQL